MNIPSCNHKSDGSFIGQNIAEDSFFYLFFIKGQAHPCVMGGQFPKRAASPKQPVYLAENRQEGCPPLDKSSCMSAVNQRVLGAQPCTARFQWKQWLKTALAGQLKPSAPPPLTQGFFKHRCQSTWQDHRQWRWHGMFEESALTHFAFSVSP